MSHRPAKIAGVIRGVTARFALEIPPSVATAVSVVEVRVSADLAYADVFVSAISGADRAAEALQKRKGEIRNAIAVQVKAYTVPVLRFHADTRGEAADKLDRLIDSL